MREYLDCKIEDLLKYQKDEDSLLHVLNEPPHVHIDRDDLSVKFWLSPVHLARNIGFPPKDLSRLEKMVAEHQQELMEKWNGYFSTSS